jgi:hypothetical protein
LSDGTRYGLRALWFVVRTAAIILIIIGLFYLAFNAAMEASNIYIISTEGMEKRAEVILEVEEPQELSEYFTAEYLEQDQTLLSSPYKGFTISNYDYSVEINGLFVLPWSDKGTVKLTERVRRLEQKVAAAEGEAAEPAPLPQWENNQYEMTLSKNEEGRWYISGLKIIGQAPALEYEKEQQAG